MNLSRYYFAGLRLAKSTNDEVLGPMAQGGGVASRASRLGCKTIICAPVGALSPLCGSEQEFFLFPGRGAFRTYPRLLPALLRRENQVLLIVDLLKLTPSSKPVPCPLRASETSPLVIA